MSEGGAEGGSDLENERTDVSFTRESNTYVLWVVGGDFTCPPDGIDHQSLRKSPIRVD